MKTLKQRFDAKWMPEPFSGCWLWTACVLSTGYGRINRRGAHRVSWELHRGSIPKGMEVCHSCDTPMCVNPEHLFLGTHADNLRDAVVKGRCSRGSGHPNVKLTDAQVLHIHDTKGSATTTARQFGIGTSTVYAIRLRKTWRHLLGNKNAPVDTNVKQPPTCKCGNPCVWYGFHGGFSKKCLACNEDHAFQQRRSRERMQGEKLAKLNIPRR